MSLRVSAKFVLTTLHFDPTTVHNSSLDLEECQSVSDGYNGSLKVTRSYGSIPFRELSFFRAGSEIWNEGENKM